MSAVLDTTGTAVVLPDVVEAAGCVLRTRDGRELLDLESGVWCTTLGHAHPAVAAALAGASPAHVGYRWSSQVVPRAAQRLAGLCGLPDGRALLLTSGSEAVELAVRIAAAVTGRAQFVRLGGHYLSAYGQGGVPSDGRWRTSESLEALDEAALDSTLAGVAAFVIEPGNASGMVRLPDAERVRRLAARVRAAGGLVVADEVTTGFGRTGTWLGIEHLGVVPDVVALGKGCGNGYPVSAVVVSGAVAEAVAGSGLRYAQSHQNDPAGAAVVLAVADAVEREDLLRRSTERGAQLRAGLAGLAARTSAIRRVRGLGLMCAFDVAPGTALAVQAGLLARGYLVGANALHDAVRVYPPLVISAEQVAAFLVVAGEVLGVTVPTT
ncbi:MAG TPA: aminotransferase class III-fold pyridoxal phosphate-dependent enzyme [Cellulomonas sp.]